MKSNFDKHPAIRVEENKEACRVGWESICDAINAAVKAKKG